MLDEFSIAASDDDKSRVLKYRKLKQRLAGRDNVSVKKPIQLPKDERRQIDFLNKHRKRIERLAEALPKQMEEERKVLAKLKKDI